jgi:hypothetical protein
LNQVNSKLRLVCATRCARRDFFARTALGRSLAVFPLPIVELVLFDNNTTGLPILYNKAIRDCASDPAVLVFLHDDIYLCDFFWPLHVFTGLQAFDIIGLAGNRRRLPGQPAWAFIDTNMTWDSFENLSGVVAHGKGFPPVDLNIYGAPGQPVKLLDGLLLAVRSQALLAHALEFDERFDFHFYDLDFCRQAEVKNLRMGTWTISAVHESGGNFSSTAWRDGYARYLDKWGS